MGKKRRAESEIPFDCEQAFVFDSGDQASKAAQDLIHSVKKSRRIASLLSKRLTKEKEILPNQGKSLSDPLQEVDTLLQEVERILVKDLRYNLRDLVKAKN